MIIVGAGLAGLACAQVLRRHDIDFIVLESSDGPGGRVRSDIVDGHICDRGFQILLTGYPEAQRALDLETLDLQPFAPGARIRIDGRFHDVGDPLRRPGDLVGTVRAPIGSMADKLRILAYRREVTGRSLPDIWQAPDLTARQRLEDLGFSDRMVERFFQPLFAGITLDPSLGGSSRVLDFVFRTLALGDAAVPAAGMGAISDQLSQGIEPSTRYGQEVAEVATGEVRLADGTTLRADRVVVATGQTAAAKLTGSDDRGWNGVTSLWLSAPEPPLVGSALVLDADGGPINSMAVMSEVAGSYAPAGRSAVVVSAPTVDDDWPDQAMGELRRWFGAVVDSWDRLRVDRIPRAQPVQRPGRGRTGPVETAEHVLVTGDHTLDASINGALLAGTQAGERVVAGRR